MNTGLDQYMDIFKYGSHVEQTYRNAFGLKKSKSIDWFKLNVSLAKRFFGKQGRWAIAIDPSYISKAGKKTPHIGRFWSGCAQSVKHGLEIMGIGLIDIDAKDCMTLRVHLSLSNKELSFRNKTMVDFYIYVIKRYRKELLKLSTLIVADAYFSTSTFVNGIKKEGFSLISRFRDNACLFYVYAGPRTGKRGRPKTKDGKIDMKNLDLTRSGEEVFLYYRTRFQIEFCFRDAKGYTGHMDCQARDKWKLYFAFNASFTSLNVAKVTMKEMGMEYSMSSFKSLMTNTYLMRRIFKACGYNPNRTLISKIFKDLSCLQRIAA
ncbi:transposase [Prevotella sp. AM34-19LB]|uniref:transposase n=1 Tax=Prevotella sp. AM34-19LB TaxID=2292364 RepID=UPI000E5CF6B5|nr:transposase [Prevotella sp. AM34-19LB]RHC77569.1 transposase [Prevotella sp. AM34-19LB]